MDIDYTDGKANMKEKLRETIRWCIYHATISGLTNVSSLQINY